MVGLVSDTEKNPEIRAAREGVMRKFVGLYQKLYPSSLFPASDPESRKKAIRFVCENIFTVYMKQGRQPFTVGYSIRGSDVVTYKVENPILEFQQALVDIQPDSESKRMIAAEIDQVMNEISGKSPGNNKNEDAATSKVKANIATPSNAKPRPSPAKGNGLGGQPL